MSEKEKEYQQRVRDKRRELNDRLQRLVLFMNSSEFAGLSVYERDLLEKQRGLMHRLDAVLCDRINLFKEDTGRFNFSTALAYLRKGKKLTREVWSEQWICLSPGKTAVAAENLWAPHNKEYAISKDGSANVAPYFTMKHYTGDIVPWQPTQHDLLADDWQLC